MMVENSPITVTTIQRYNGKIHREHVDIE